MPTAVLMSAVGGLTLPDIPVVADLICIGLLNWLSFAERLLCRRRHHGCRQRGKRAVSYEMVIRPTSETPWSICSDCCGV